MFELSVCCAALEQFISRTFRTYRTTSRTIYTFQNGADEYRFLRFLHYFPHQRTELGSIGCGCR